MALTNIKGYQIAETAVSGGLKKKSSGSDSN